MAKIDLSNLALPQETITVDDVDYLITALPATEGLKFLEKYQETLDTGKPDLATMKHIICMSVTKDGKMLTEKAGSNSLSFDIYFARKLGHMRNLFQEVLEFNFNELFAGAASEE